MPLLDLVFRYRTLMGKCELSMGLSFDEIDELGELEALFQSDDGRRRFRRSPMAMSALIRSSKYNDHVKVTQLSAGGLECRGAPYVEEGTLVELILDVDDHSFRFSGRAVWMRDDGADYRVAFAFEGTPVMVQGVLPTMATTSASTSATSKLMSTIYQRLSVAA
ncbi:MAG: PilZ domain-containing protein [Kofleriaceae bacterium]